MAYDGFARLDVPMLMCGDGTFSAAVHVALVFTRYAHREEEGMRNVCGRGRFCKSTSSDEKYR